MPVPKDAKFETVAVIVTEPVVCAKAAVALIISKAVIARVVKMPLVDLNMSLLLLVGVITSSRVSE